MAQDERSGTPGPRDASPDRLSPGELVGLPTLAGGWPRRLLDFLAALRAGGLTATQSEAIDAFRTLGHLDLLHRDELREGLAAVTVTSRRQRKVFDELFELYFPLRGGSSASGPPGDERDLGDPTAHDPREELLEALHDGAEERIRRAAQRAVASFGRVEGHDGRSSYFRYRVMRAVDPGQLLEELVRRAQGDGEEGRSDLEERLLRDELEARLRLMEHEVDAEIRQRTAAQRGREHVVARLLRPPVEDLDFFHLTAADQVQIRALIQPLARKLAARLAAKRRRGRTGRLDVRRTVRRSLSSGGVPFEPSFRSRRPHKPELVVICDVSGSVASFARFTLMLVHALQGQFTRVRTFAFIDTLDEVTSLFDSDGVATATSRMFAEAELVWRDGHSDYGRSFDRFHAEYVTAVTARTTVLILGDARNNHRQSGSWVLAELHRRARRVFWLNPEPVAHWNTGDSIARSYARHVDEMVEVRNLRQLARFVERIA